MIELFLVRRDLHSYYTNFWDRARHCWPADVFGSLGCMRVASAQALQTYRDHYRTSTQLQRSNPLAGCGALVALSATPTGQRVRRFSVKKVGQVVRSR